MNKDGQVTLNDVAKLYDASQHPEVRDGKKSEEEVYMEFMGLWDTQHRDGVVTIEEFQEYYKDVSCSVDSDEEFVAILTAAWKVE